jgi:hypothetical protein
VRGVVVSIGVAVGGGGGAAALHRLAQESR